MDTIFAVITFIALYGFAFYHNITTAKRTID